MEEYGIKELCQAGRADGQRCSRRARLNAYRMYWFCSVHARIVSDRVAAELPFTLFPNHMPWHRYLART